MTDTAAIKRLALYRLERDLTCEALAAEMTAAGYRMRYRTLQYLLAGHHQPLATTGFRIRRFVERVVEGGVSAAPPTAQATDVTA